MARVYVGNLDPNVQKDELIDIANAYGKLADVWVARNPPGFAFVTYEEHRDAEDAVNALSDRTIGGQVVRAEIATQGPSAGDDDNAVWCGVMQELARKKARESLRSLSPEEVAYLLLDLGVDPAIAFAFEQSRVSADPRPLASFALT